MIYRAIVLYVAVQSVVVASPTVNLQLGEPIVSPIGVTFYHPTPASKARTIPEVGKLPRPAVSKKIPSGGPIKFNPGNHLSRNGHNLGIDTYQPTKSRNNHIHLEESHLKPRAQISNEERAEKINSDMEKMIQFITVLGQVDRYLSSRAKSFVSTLGRAMDNNPDDHHIYSDKDISSNDY